MSKSKNNIPDPQNSMIQNPRKRVQISFKEPSLTKQYFKQECDINYIVNKFQKTGEMPSQNRLEPQFGEQPTQDLKQALDTVKNLKREFKELDAETRAKFDNDFTKYGQMLSDYEADPDSFYNFSDEENELEPKAPKSEENSPKKQPEME